MRKEAAIDVGPLVFVDEYAPHLNENKYGDIHTLQLNLASTLADTSVPRQPMNPDLN